MATEASRADGRPGPRSILVVEDEPQLLELMVRVLEREGWRVRTASGADEAAAAIAADASLAAAVVDMAIRPTGARPVLEAALQCERPPGLVLASGDLLAPDLRDLLEACRGVFLAKPFAPAAFLDAVERSIERAGA